VDRSHVLMQPIPNQCPQARQHTRWSPVLPHGSKQIGQSQSASSLA
jgi:hypothetical protein